MLSYMCLLFFSKFPPLCNILMCPLEKCTLPWQWSLITISREDHSFYPMFPTDHCRRVPIFRRKVRWRSNTYDGHLSFDVAFTCSTMMRCGVYDLIVWRFKCFSSNLVLRYERFCGKWVTCVRAYDVGNDFSAYQVSCYNGFGFAERQILFSDGK